MHALTTNRVSRESTSKRELPDDLRSWLPAYQVLALATESVELVIQDPAFRNGNFEHFNVLRMLALLSYCYATNRSGSEDVEWAAANDEAIRKTSARDLPDASAIRRFRRIYRPWILQCLICLLKLAMAQSVEKSSKAAYAEARTDMVGWASRKIQLAVLMDAAAAD